MALSPRDIPITREMVAGWLADYEQTQKAQTLETYLKTRVGRLQLDDPMVDVSQRDDYTEPEVHVVQMILDDLPSYGYSDPQ